MKILIATGIYPPEVGGPAQYAKQLREALNRQGHDVKVQPFSWFRRWPTGLRHVLYFFRLLWRGFRADVIIALDTYSVALPSVWVKLLTGTPVVIRTGGNFLWEWYVERTKEKIVFPDFYKEKRNFTLKEKIIFVLTKFIMRQVSHVVFSTVYQRDVFIPAYSIPESKTSLIENYYGGHTYEKKLPQKKNFVCFVRPLVWKNIDMLKEAFEKAQKQVPNISLELAHNLTHQEVLERVGSAYASVLISLGDISPNFILESVMLGTPCILTKETGLRERLKDVALFVDPLDVDDIARGIVTLADSTTYEAYRKKVAAYTYTHSYDDIASEFVELIKGI